MSEKPQYELACPKCGCRDEDRLGVRQRRMVYHSMEKLDMRNWNFSHLPEGRASMGRKKLLRTGIGEAHEVECGTTYYFCYECGYETRSDQMFLRVVKA